MAYATTEAVVDDAPRTKEDHYEVMRRRYAACVDAEMGLRAKAVEDFKFIWIAGQQWDNNFGQLRGTRPKYEFNKLRQAVKQVVNDMRQNTPSIKVRAFEDGDVDLAEIRQGMIRNIESQSNADVVYDWGGLYAVSCGYGAWRVNRVYVDDNGFDQDLRIERVHNPFSIRFDPNARELDRRDAAFAFVEDEITREEYKRRYPGKECIEFKADLPDSMRHWATDKAVRIAEYWKRVPVRKERLLLSTGAVVDAEDFNEGAAALLPEPITVTQRRTVETTKVTVEIVNGRETLEGPFDWPGKFIPLVPVWGDIVHVDGKDDWYGMARHSRDAVILNNFAMSTFAEVVAKQPNAPFLYTPKHVEGHEDKWRNAAVNDDFGLPVNPDPDFPGGLPKREMPPEISPGYMALLNLTSDAIKSTTGIYDAGLGARSNETSGRAIMARQREGDIANFDYADNIHRAIRYTGEIIDDLIPHVYDAERSVRILGEDGGSKFVKINEPVLASGPNGPEWIVKNDMRQGRYDVTITTGPSYTTQRMEALDAFMQLAQTAGPGGLLAQYAALVNMDVPGMDEVKAGMRRILIQQGLLQPGEKDGPPPAPPGPSPKDVADAELKGAQAAKATAEAEQTTVETQRMVAQDQFALANTPIPTDVPGLPPVPIGPPMPLPTEQGPSGPFLLPGA